MGTLAVVLQVLLLLVGMFMILIVLLQRGRGGGLAGAFGGMGGQSAFGTKAGDVFTRITVVVAAIWVVLAGVSGVAMRKSANTYAESLPEGVESLESEEEATSGDDASTIPPLGGDAEEADIPATPPITIPPGEATPPLQAPDTEPPPAETKTPQSPQESSSGNATPPAADSTSAPAEPSTTPPSDATGEQKDSAPAPAAESTPPAEGANETNPGSSGS